MEDAYIKYYKPLVGATITAVGVQQDSHFGDRFYTLTARLADGSTVLLTPLADPEGNGAGHLDIAKLTKAVTK